MQAAAGIHEHLGFGDGEVERAVPLEELTLPAPRLEPPASLAPLCSTETYDRAAHSYGKAYRDVVRAFRGRFDHVTDVVARPRDEDDVAALLDWCSDAGAAAIPYGGGTSVVGGVEPRFERPAVTIDLHGLDRVLEVDDVSRAARIQAGATGPRLEEQLKRAGSDAAPLPAVVRVLDARRLDRHPRRRPLRHALHAHRRPGRVGTRAHPARASGRAGGCPDRAPGRAPTGC